MNANDDKAARSSNKTQTPAAQTFQRGFAFESGEGEIRTPGELAPTLVFETTPDVPRFMLKPWIFASLPHFVRNRNLSRSVAINPE